MILPDNIQNRGFKQIDMIWVHAQAMLAQDSQDREVRQRLDGVVLVKRLSREGGDEALGARQDATLVVDVKRRPEVLCDRGKIRLQTLLEPVTHRHLVPPG